METVNFGRAGVKVSRLALGLGLRGQDDPAAAQRMIEYAIDHGINLIDCANVYSLLDNKQPGISEEILARALKGRRDQVIITSKVASRVGQGPNDAGLSSVHILREIDNSLRRLETDYIDMYLVHVYDATTPLDETMRALDDVVRAGKVRYIGCCNFSAWQVCRANWLADRVRGAQFNVIQNEYSLLTRGPEQELFGVVRELGLGMMAYSPLAVGLLSGVYSPGTPPPSGSYWDHRGAEAYARVMNGPAGRVLPVLFDAAEALGKTPAQVALAWVLAHPEVTCAITGGDTIAHLDDNLGAVGWTLDPALVERLNEASSVRPAFES